MWRYDCAWTAGPAQVGTAVRDRTENPLLEIVSLVLRIALIVLGLAMLALSMGSVTRRGVGARQRARFVFTAGVSMVGVLRGAQLFSTETLPLWELIVVDVLFAVGVWGAAGFYREFPSGRPPSR